MRNVNLRIMEGAILHVRRLSGTAVSARPGQPVVLDDKNSYVIRVESGEAAIGYEDLARVMNEFTFDFEGAPVKGLRMAREEDAGERDQIQLTGKLRKALGVPFEIEGRPEATKDGRIRIRTTSIQALDIKVGGLLHALGMSPKSLLGDLEQRGVEVEGDDVILDPDRAMPPPRVTGHVASVRVEDAGLVLTFATPDAAGRAATEIDRLDRDEAAPKGNYLWFRKGTIRIGRMTQTDADLRIVDHDPRDPLDIDGDRLTRQLVAGYAKLGAAGGLTMIVPDYADIR